MFLCLRNSESHVGHFTTPVAFFAIDLESRLANYTADSGTPSSFRGKTNCLAKCERRERSFVRTVISFRCLRLKRPFYNSFAGCVPTGSQIFTAASIGTFLLSGKIWIRRKVPMHISVATFLLFGKIWIRRKVRSTLSSWGVSPRVGLLRLDKVREAGEGRFDRHLFQRTGEADTRKTLLYY